MAQIGSTITHETGDLTQYTGTDSATGYTVAASGSAAKNGSFGLLATANSASDTNSGGDGYKDFTYPGTNVVVASAWVQFTAWTSGGYNTDTSKAVLALRDAANLSLATAWLSVVGTRTLQLKYQTAAFAAASGAATLALSAATWYLLELTVDRSGGTHVVTFRYSTDGTNFTTVESITANVAGSVTRVHAGVAHINQFEKAQYTVAVDDVALYDAVPAPPAGTKAPVPLRRINYLWQRRVG